MPYEAIKYTDIPKTKKHKECLKEHQWVEWDTQGRPSELVPGTFRLKDPRCGRCGKRKFGFANKKR